MFPITLLSTTATNIDFGCSCRYPPSLSLVPLQRHGYSQNQNQRGLVWY